jgi:hypothetical protein
MTHELRIHSLHDAHATCSCGQWEMVRTGEMERAELETMHKQHVNYWRAMFQLGQHGAEYELERARR